MTRWRLEPEAGGPPVPVPDGRTLVVGRAIASDIHLPDETVSRQHAELRAEDQALLVRDLGSANGTLHNDAALLEGRVLAGDALSFGRVRFRLARDAAAPAGTPDPEELPPGTLVRALAIDSGEQALHLLHRDRLARLVELARELSGVIDTASLLEGVVTHASALLSADRTALLLRDDATGEFRVTHWLNRLGKAAVTVPRSIVQRAIADRVPVVTENARADARFQSGSVVLDQVRAALAVPLLDEALRVLGVLYVDSLTAAEPFSEADAALCLAFGGLAAVAITRSRMSEAARRQEVIRANLERFVAPSVAARISERASPGGERRAVTVLFSDIRGFTALAESLPPEAVAAHLSDYFAVMVDLVFEHGGMLDKFVGDALLAVWGAPETAEGDAARAVRAARAMQEELARLNARWTAAGRPPLRVGIGLHSGEAFAGLIGSPKRLEFTVIGDVVNVAARLCKAAQPGEILVSDATRALLPGQPQGLARGLDLGGREVRAWSLGASGGS